MSGPSPEDIALNKWSFTSLSSVLMPAFLLLQLLERRQVLVPPTSKEVEVRGHMQGQLCYLVENGCRVSPRSGLHVLPPSCA